MTVTNGTSSLGINEQLPSRVMPLKDEQRAIVVDLHVGHASRMYTKLLHT